MQISEPTARKERRFAVIFLMVLSYFTIVQNFWYPSSLFWDENYHIASAQKYLNGVFYMEPHPPLGKLMIALGEKITNMNAKDDQFIGTDYATNPPQGFSFFGYRLFPILFAWFTVPLLFGIFYILTKRNILWASLFSFLYIFDNALLVHLRSAMLESTMLFFCVLTIYAFLLAWEYRDDKKKFLWFGALFGFAFGAALATKAFALILILLVPALAWMLWPRWKKLLPFLLWGLIAFAITYCGIWQVHFSLAQRINPSLPDNGYYQASEQYKAILAAKATSSPLSFPVMLNDSLKFVTHYENGVPRLDLCKADENGSPWFFWPFGARTIDYRWETPDGHSYRYLYLVPNPVVWGIGLLGILLSIVLLLGAVFFPSEEYKLHNRNLLLVMSGMYVSYMIAISTIDRVMYLYHYFLPLIFTFILFALCFMELRQFMRWKLTEERKGLILFILAILIFLGFEYFRAFTFYEPLTDRQFQNRNLLQLWDMRCVHCDRNSLLVVPRNS